MSEQIDQHAIVLKNGLKIVYNENPTAESTSFNLCVGSKEKPENREVAFAMNHLIEHCLRISNPQMAKTAEAENLRPKDCQTYYDRIEFRHSVQENDKVGKVLDCYGEMFSDWAMPHLSAERNVIFEEWNHIFNQPDKWRFLSDFFDDKKNTFEFKPGIKLLKDDYLTSHHDRITDWFNDQINYTFDFPDQMVQDCARHLYGADNMTLYVSGPMPQSDFFALVQASKCQNIPRCSVQNPLEHITDQSAHHALSSHEDMRNHPSSDVRLNTNLSDEKDQKIAQAFMKAFMSKGLQKEEPNAYILDFEKSGLHAKISSAKTDLMLKKITRLIKDSQNPDNISFEHLQSVCKKLKDPSITKANLVSVMNKIAKNGNFVVNGTEKPLPNLEKNSLQAKLTTVASKRLQTTAVRQLKTATRE